MKRDRDDDELGTLEVAVWEERESKWQRVSHLLASSSLELEQGEAETALESAQQATKVLPNDEFSYIRTAKALLALGRVGEAKTALNAARQLASSAQVDAYIGEMIVSCSKSHISKLPTEILQRVFSNVSTLQLAGLQGVCKAWQGAILSRPQLWTNIAVEKYPKRWKLAKPLLKIAMRHSQDLGLSLSGSPAKCSEADLLMYDVTRAIDRKRLKAVSIDLSAIRRSRSRSLTYALTTLLSDSRLEKLHFTSFPDYSYETTTFREDLYKSFISAKDIKFLTNQKVDAMDTPLHVLKVAEDSIERFEWRQCVGSGAWGREARRAFGSISAPLLDELILEPTRGYVGYGVTIATQTRGPVISAPVRVLRLNEVSSAALRLSLPNLLSPRLEKLSIHLGECTPQIEESIHRCTSLTDLVVHGHTTHDSQLHDLLETLTREVAIPLRMLEVRTCGEDDGEKIMNLVRSRSDTGRPLHTLKTDASVTIADYHFLMKKVENLETRFKRTPLPDV